MYILITTVVLCLIQCGHLVNINITGGPYQQHRYMNTHVILAYQGIGPKMCVEECMLHNGCNAVNFRRNELTCELLTLAYTGAQPISNNEIYYTAIDTWSRDKNQCWPNPCEGRTKCVVAKHDQYVCITFDAPCDAHQCKNKGVCRNEVNTYRCICPAGYYGTYCQNTPCTRRPCCNGGGPCVISGSTWSCRCPSGYSGRSCQNTPCTGKSCYQGGTCVISGSTWYCWCPSGYYGTICQNTPCTGRSCNNGGICVISGSTWYCQCPSGYYGTICQNTPCTGRSCNNGGICVISGSTWYCQCPSGYYGTICQNTPCTGKSCYLGGTCVISGSTWYCLCPSGYYGGICQFSGR